MTVLEQGLHHTHHSRDSALSSSLLIKAHTATTMGHTETTFLASPCCYGPLLAPTTLNSMEGTGQAGRKLARAPGGQQYLGRH